MRQILSKRLTVRGFINYDFAAEHYADFLREVGAGIAAGRIRYREDVVDGLENAPGGFHRNAGGAQLRQDDRPGGRLSCLFIDLQGLPAAV
jgi:NADPH-dependent curcumin reductase CurA